MMLDALLVMACVLAGLIGHLGSGQVTTQPGMVCSQEHLPGWDLSPPR